jgi:hypothetical protein
MTIRRDRLLKCLTDAKHNEFVKIITGIRRCGKSYLLFKLFKSHLVKSGVRKDHIIEIDLENTDFYPLHNPLNLLAYIKERIKKDGRWNYVFIDEIQNCQKVLPPGIDLSNIHPDDRESAYITFYSVLSELRTMRRVDVYVTGSNSKLLISDVATIFRGRGQSIQVTPLSLAEFMPLRKGSESQSVFDEYLTFGGLPKCALLKSDGEKKNYLADLYRTIYIRDIVERNKIKNPEAAEALLDVVMSGIGGLTNPNKIADTMKTAAKMTTSNKTVDAHLGFLENAFLIAKARRFDVKGRRYLESPCKYYATDTGLRNARINFRQNEPTHLMENVIYNELVRRGYSVDVGVVPLETRASGKHEIRQYEIDFVVNKADERIYIQSAYAIPDAEKRAQETFSLRHVNDNFRKVVITGNLREKPWRDENGIVFIGAMPFLLDPRSLETL